MSDKEKWDKRYDTTDMVCGCEPSEFLSSNADYLPASGLALELAAGEGRNSMLLAERGMEVVAVDISLRALEKCIRIARQRNLPVSAVVADLNEFIIAPQTFDLITVFNYLQRDLAAGMIAGLRPGGHLVCETMTVDTLRFRPKFNPDFLLRRGEYIEMFRGLRILKYRESILGINSSKRAVASIIARKSP